MMGLEFHFSTSFHPPIDRQTKKVSILLEQYLRQFVSANQRDWTKLMIVCQFSYIVRRSEATNKNSLSLVPHILMIGYMGRSFIVFKFAKG